MVMSGSFKKTKLIFCESTFMSINQLAFNLVVNQR